MAILTSAFQVTASATQIATSGNQSIIAYNNGPNTVWIGQDNTVTSATGFPIPPGGSLRIDHRSADVRGIFAICSVLQVSPNDTRLLVEV